MDVIIEPDKGMAKEIGQQLLELADDPRDVRWVSWPKAGYKVPAELAEKLKGARPLPDAGPEGVAETEPVRRRPGRPRRNPVQDTDDTEKEE